MIKEKIEKHKIAIGISFILLLILVATITFIIMTSKPYEKYDDNILLNYNFDVIDGEVFYYLYTERNYATDGVSILRIAERNVQIYYRHFDMETRKMIYIKAFKVDMYYDMHNFKVIKLNDVPKRVKNLEITQL